MPPGGPSQLAAPGPDPGLAHRTASVVLEVRDREYVQQRVRAGVLEQATMDLMDEVGQTILGFMEELNEVDVAGVEPMTSVTPMQMKKRQDVVTDGGDAEAILKNAPATQDNYFLVPKVVE